jgi:hypothetical protein
MAKHEGTIRSNARANAVWGSGKIAALAAAVVAAIAVAAPGTAGAAAGSGVKAYNVSGSSAVIVGYNASMAVDLSGPGTSSGSAVSWSDVSWSDAL